MAATAPNIDLCAWQEHFDFLLPRKELLRCDEVARALGCDERTVQRHFDSAALHGHDINAGTGQRAQLRYRRDSVILFLADRANYSPSDFRVRLLEVMAKQSPHELALIHQAIGEMLRRKL